MGTGIEWTDETWNPVTGCTKVSPGCDHCYAETIAHRFAGGVAFPNGFDLTLLPHRLEQPLHWRRPRRVFVNSMSDLFHADVPAEFIAEAFAVMAVTPQHTYQILTKRHARMRAVLRSPAFQQQVQIRQRAGVRPTFGFTEAWPLPNVWLGVSVETQQWADIRVPALLDTPAAVRFLSCEPLLGPVNLFTRYDDFPIHGGLVDWVIVGGESGPHARPMHADWARALRDQCRRAGVPYFFKQWGEHAPRCTLALCGTPCSCNGLSGGHPIQMRRVGKKAAGRELDGRTWDQYPQAVTA